MRLCYGFNPPPEVRCRLYCRTVCRVPWLPQPQLLPFRVALMLTHTKQYYSRKNTQQSLKRHVVSVGHPVGVSAPGTGVAANFAPTPPLGFPTGA